MSQKTIYIFSYTIIIFIQQQKKRSSSIYPKKIIRLLGRINNRPYKSVSGPFQAKKNRIPTLSPQPDTCQQYVVPTHIGIRLLQNRKSAPTHALQIPRFSVLRTNTAATRLSLPRKRQKTRRRGSVPKRAGRCLSSRKRRRAERIMRSARQIHLIFLLQEEPYCFVPIFWASARASSSYVFPPVWASFPLSLSLRGR